MTTLTSSVTGIGSYAFYGCYNLLLTSLPNITMLNDYTFYSCSRLALTSLPNTVTSINNSCFSGCYTLTLTSLPSGLTSIGNNAFDGCRNIAITTIPDGVTNIPNSSFRSCNSIENISSNAAITSLGYYAFQSSSSSYPMSLKTARFPNMSISSLYAVFGSTTAYQACQLLELLDLGTVGTITANTLANCYSLETLILRKSDGITQLATTSAFTNTPMSGYNSMTGTVYVPSALINSYKTATNWSSLYNAGTVTFAAIEGSEYELD